MPRAPVDQAKLGFGNLAPQTARFCRYSANNALRGADAGPRPALKTRA